MRRIVVKLGTNVVTHETGELALGRVFSILEELAKQQQAGRQVLLVSSGAVGLGAQVLGLAERPRSLGMRQACAAAGQGRLISLYGQAFAQLGVKVAQVLLTQEDLADPDRTLALRTTLLRLIELKVIPILNENDSVSVRELIEYDLLPPFASENGRPMFGDNDGLSARIAASINADLLLLLSDVDGVYTANPKVDPDARLISSSEGVNEELLAVAGGQTSSGGTGGMNSKLEAARKATAAGVDVVIAKGDAPGVVERVLAGDELGTLIFSPTPPERRRQRIAHRHTGKAALIVNEGAIEALTESKASLLPIGLLKVEGSFDRGDVVEVRDISGRIFGHGLVNYDAAACRQLAGHHSREIASILGWRGYDALITRDNLTLADI